MIVIGDPVIVTVTVWPCGFPVLLDEALDEDENKVEVLFNAGIEVTGALTPVERMIDEEAAVGKLLTPVENTPVDRLTVGRLPPDATPVDSM